MSRKVGIDGEVPVGSEGYLDAATVFADRVGLFALSPSRASNVRVS